jgi:hypothetical protein
MNGAALWSLGLVLSAGLHGAVLVVVPRAFAPEPVADQPMPRSEMRVETEAVAQSESAAIPPPADVTAAGSTAGANLAQGVIQQSRATAAAVEAPRLAAAAAPVGEVAEAAPPVVTAAAAMPEAQAAAVAAPVAEAMVVAAPEAEAMAVAAPEGEAVAVSAPVAAVAAVAAPVGEVVAVAAPVGAVAGAVETAGQVLAAAAVAAEPVASSGGDVASVPEAVPASVEITAELAFSGDGGVALDPQALATIQSFMEAGDTASAASEARDSLEALLSQVPCSRLQAEFDPETGTIALRGHIPEEALRAPVLEALQAQVGQGIAVTDAMLILPRPQCGALAGIGSVGLPQSTDQTTNPRIVGNDAHARVFDYRGGEKLVLEMQAPDYDAYVYVDYYDAAGNVIHLVPNDVVPLVLHPAQSAMVVGQAADGAQALEIVVGPPYGQEIAVAFAASAPLYEGLRPTVEEAGPYLEWLAARVAEARAADPAFKGEWVYFFVATRAE